MSAFVCPACQRTFDEPGFCPFDRTALASVAAVAQRTQLSVAMDAVAAPTEIEQRRSTFPLSPTPPADPPPAHAARTRPVPDSQIRAVSASGNAAKALEAYEGQRSRENDYDKLVGATLDGRYFVDKKIGEGGMGVVFAARHAVIERPLAIKVLKREVMRDAATIKRFVQEAKAASRIGHPNIVDVTDFGTTPDGMTYSVMEFVEGPTLGGALRAAAPFPMSRAIRIAVQIARALGAAHDKGIVHRDLKPENVFLVDRDGRPDFVKIVDFGIAKVAPQAGAADEPRLTRAGSVFGTPEYMAPEQAAGRSDTDARVDVYALGVILYEMITGQVPHRGDTMMRTLTMQMLDPVEPPRKVRPDLDISIELEGVIMRSLAKKREQRFDSMADVLAALDRLQTPVGQSVTGSPVYALASLPPGAETIVPSAPAKLDDSLPIVVAMPVSEVMPAATTRTKAPTNRRLRDEPEFVTRDKPITFEHVFTEEIRASRGRRWPIVLLFALILGGAAAAIGFVVYSRDRVVTTAAHRDAGVSEATPDATVVVEVPADAVLREAPVDALDIVIVETDAGRRIARTSDAGVRPVIVQTPNGRGTISIQVITKPEGATLYAGHSYRGPGGTNVEQPFGARLDITCKHAGYKPGTVSLVFDGKTEVALCVLQRIKICIDNIKNPFDDCELDPSKPMPGDDELQKP
ncbi:MAG: serine/threonine protein kinase [Deltaproteobacteria bacterium]|nr:serine/threonine protein kinase [Deltaproteobacteria bacterium]MDQ3298512.1 serine/threonine protein kinase [Myxococcota bacterium]